MAKAYISMNLDTDDAGLSSAVRISGEVRTVEDIDFFIAKFKEMLTYQQDKYEAPTHT